MQVVLTKNLVMDDSHSFSLSGLPISAGEQFTVVVMRENSADSPRPIRKVYAHRIAIDHIELPARESVA